MPPNARKSTPAGGGANTVGNSTAVEEDSVDDEDPPGMQSIEETISQGITLKQL